MSASARADGEQHFAAESVFHLFEVERRFSLVAQHFEHGRPALFRDFHTTVVKLNDVHLKGLHLKVASVPAVRAGQCHASILSL